MASAPTLTEIRTLADLLARLGGISPDRIRFHPAPGTATKRDLLALDAKGEKRIELIDGVLVEKGMGFKEGVVAATLTILLGGFVRSNKLGILAGADSTVELWEDHVRIPDVAYVSWDRLPNGVPDEPIPELAPNLAVAVFSRSNTEAEMARKRADFFQAGVQLMWIVYPLTQTVRVFTDVENFTELSADDTLTGGDVLPGFEVKVNDIFAELDRGQ